MAKQEHVRWLIDPKQLTRCVEIVRVATDREGVWVNESIILAPARYMTDGTWMNVQTGATLVAEEEVAEADQAKVVDLVVTVEKANA